MTLEEMLFALLRYEICGTPLPEGDRAYDAENLLALAKHHDMAHLVTAALEANGILPEDDGLREAYERERMTAVYREIRIRSVTDLIRETFRQENIRFVPLKGSIIRSMYPEPWMRTSCDIDILIREEDFDRATEALKQKGFTTDGVRHYHDVSFFYGGVHLELHFHIRENMDSIDRLLIRAWDHCIPVDGVEYVETPAFFLFHHIAHMSYHFVAGGCGIKPFLDLWILRKNGYYREEELAPFLEETDLMTFYRSVCELTDVWLDGKPHTDLTRRLAAYIVTGGVYGSLGNSAAAGTIRKKGKFRYLWSVAFPSYFYMCILYPILKKLWILLPVFYVYRLITKIFGKDRGRVKARWENAMNQDQGKVDALRDLLNSVGLDHGI